MDSSMMKTKTHYFFWILLMLFIPIGINYGRYGSTPTPSLHQNQYLQYHNVNQDFSDDEIFLTQSMKNRFNTNMNHHFNDSRINRIRLDVDTLSSINSSDMLFSLSSITASDQLSSSKNDLKSGNYITTWIDKTSTKKSEKLILNVDMDISSFSNEELYVGFFGSTKESTKVKLIEIWSFKFSGFLPVRPKIIKFILWFSVSTVEKYERLEKLAEHVTRKIPLSAVDSHSSKSSLYLIFEYLDVDLSMFIDSYRMGTNHRLLEHHLVQRFMLQLCKSVSHCHSLVVIHCDLKPQNLSLDDHRYVGDLWTVALDMWFVGCIFFCLALMVLGYLNLKKLKSLFAEKGLKTELITGLKEFIYKDLYRAAKGFHSSRVIGRGMFGDVCRAPAPIHPTSLNDSCFPHSHNPLSRYKDYIYSSDFAPCFHTTKSPVSVDIELTFCVVGTQFSSYASSLSKADVAMSILLTGFTVKNQLRSVCIGSTLVSVYVLVMRMLRRMDGLEELIDSDLTSSICTFSCCNNFPLISTYAEEGYMNHSLPDAFQDSFSSWMLQSHPPT